MFGYRGGKIQGRVEISAMMKSNGNQNTDLCENRKQSVHLLDCTKEQPQWQGLNEQEGLCMTRNNLTIRKWL